MTRCSLSLPLRLFPTLVLAAPAAWSQTDTIHLVNGDKIERVKVEDYDYEQVKYQSGRIESTQPRDQVASIEFGQPAIAKLFETAKKLTNDQQYQDAFVAWIDAADKAQKSKALEPFEQVALFEAFKIAQLVGEAGDIKGVVDRLEKTKDGRSAYLPEVWAYRLDKARDSAGNDRGKLENYKEGVKQYAAFVGEKGLGDRFKFEAELYDIDAKSRLVEMKPAEAKSQLERMLPTVETNYPGLANRIHLALANAVLAAGSYDEAQKLFSNIVDSKSADDGTRAQALVGRGHSWLRRDNLTPEQARNALLDYMRVAIIYDKVGDEVVGEALYHAITAYDRWNGVDKETAKRRIRTRLKLDYSKSSWADK
ncbi:MAG: hypothetical protein H6832_05545 [Planctomycetes bacterium]|nr:hypothetical protein [Planctomycetota bacterium]MCB9917847.1 hypothetical protein [Planctomycetota bacterium]